MSDLLPVHGFVLAGGKSSRMGQDKALLSFCGSSLIEIAVAKLRTFCAHVSILGTRDDLQAHASILHDLRTGIGPGAAFETALAAALQSWVLLIPVDVPLVPTNLLRQWANDVVNESVPGASFLVVEQEPQPAFSMLHRVCGPSVAQALDRGERRLNALLYAADSNDSGPATPKNVKRYLPYATAQQLDLWFSNINTPQDLVEAEAWAQGEGWQPPG